MRGEGGYPTQHAPVRVSHQGAGVGELLARDRRDAGAAKGAPGVFEPSTRQQLGKYEGFERAKRQVKRQEPSDVTREGAVVGKQ